MSTTVEQIKSRLGIAEVIGSYITLEKSGGNLKARCPFHNEKTPSFFVSVDRNSYYCFGCGAKGDIFSFVEDFESLDFVGALKVLAERAGVPLETYKKESSEKNENERLYLANEEAAIFFQKNLSTSKEALIYLKNRGLSIETVKEWRVGFALSDWRSLKDNLTNKGFSESEIQKAGLIKEGEKGSSYDRFRGRIMFPIFDSSGRVIAFSGRLLEEKKDSVEPKYLNSPETPIFEKSKMLYGMQKAKYAIKEKGFALLVEGQIDLLMSQQAGFTNTIASSGTALTPGHVALIRRFTDRLVIAYDSDGAGQKASLRAWQLALLGGLDVEVVHLPEKKDPAEVINEGKVAWEKAVSEAEHIVDFYIKIMQSKEGREKREVIEENILPLIAAIEGSSSKSGYVTKLSFSTGIPEKEIWGDLAKVEVVSETKESDSPKQEKKKVNDNLKKTISLVFYLQKIDPVRAESFVKKVENVLPETDKILKENEAQKDILIFEAESYFGNAPNSKTEDELLYFLEEDALKENFSKTMYALKIAEGKKDKDEIDKNTTLLNEVSKKISQLKR